MEQSVNIWSLRVLEIGGADLTLLETIPIVIAVVLGAIFLRRMYGNDRAGGAAQTALHEQFAQLGEANAALERRLATLLEVSSQGHDTLRKSVDERLESVAKRLGDGLSENHKRTADSLSKLNERLALIDKAQKNIETLSSEVSGLQALLSNKQSRGAFGEIQMADIVKNFMPPKSFEFQRSLSTGARVDCLIILPNPPGPVAVDAKFPLEDWRAYSEAQDQASKDTAARGFAAAVVKHINAIADKYLIPGETADTALMFLPSEAVYATLHADFPDVVDKGFKKRVMIVSPTTFMATLHTMRAVMRDAQMREQAHVIQKEVALLAEDVGRLDDRVEALRKHFDLANKDISQIQTSADKVKRRSDKIIEAELEDGEVEIAPSPAQKRLSVVE